MACIQGCGWFMEMIFIITAIFMLIFGMFVFFVFGDIIAYHYVDLPFAIVISCGVMGFMASIINHHQRFVEVEQSRWLLVLSGSYYVCCGISCYFFLAYYASQDIHLGRMNTYMTTKGDKEMIDRTQILFKCCGEYSYTNWFNIEWQGTNIEPAEGDFVISDVSGRTAVPFSCCSPDAASPCIHNYLQIDQDARLYHQGCKPALVAFTTLFAIILGSILIVLGVLMLLCAFCGTDDTEYVYDYDYEDKISIIMPPNNTSESDSQASSTGNVSVLSSPSSVMADEDTTPEEKNQDVPRDQKAVRRDKGPVRRDQKAVRRDPKAESRDQKTTVNGTGVPLNVSGPRSPSPVIADKDFYRTPEERNLDVLQVHEAVLLTVSPMMFSKNPSKLTESGYSDTDMESFTSSDDSY